MQRPSIVYLDSNALIGICDGIREGLRTFIDSTLTSGRYIYPFSADQIDEISTPDLSPQDQNRLSYLEKVSNNIYFCNSVTELLFKHETPFEVHKTINEVPCFFKAHEVLEEIAPYQQRRQARSSLGLDPKILNNMSGHEAVTAIDEALIRLTPNDGISPNSLRKLLEACRRFTPPPQNGFGQPSTAKLRSEERNYEICALFSFLDSFGFWPDDAKASSRGSGFTDGRHVFNASYYDFLVSEDKKLRARAEAVYNVLKIKTLVFSIEEFMQLNRS